MQYRKDNITSNISESISYDAGLRAYFLNIYNYMASALVVTGLVAYFSSQSEAFIKAMISIDPVTGQMSQSILGLIITFAPIGVVLFLSMRVHKMSINAAKGWFFAFSFIMGLSLFYIFLIYTGTSIARVFFITSGVFGSMSLYGYVTKKDLTKMGSFLMMGVFGLIIASIVNIFMQSSAMQFAISAIAVVIFVGLTAYDTQKLKNMYYQIGNNSDALARASIMGALTLYLDFINIFIHLMSLMGNRR